MAVDEKDKKIAQLEEKVKRYRDALIWVREDVVNGNVKHVEHINRIIG